MLSLSKAGAGILLYFTYDFFPLSSEPYIFPFPFTSFLMTPNLKEIVPYFQVDTPPHLAEEVSVQNCILYPCSFSRMLDPRSHNLSSVSLLLC